jgi:hypothetical protein
MPTFMRLGWKGVWIIQGAASLTIGSQIHIQAFIKYAGKGGTYLSLHSKGRLLALLISIGTRKKGVSNLTVNRLLLESYNLGPAPVACTINILQLSHDDHHE